jgi:hypothetical protein
MRKRLQPHFHLALMPFAVVSFLTVQTSLVLIAVDRQYFGGHIAGRLDSLCFYLAQECDFE